MKEKLMRFMQGRYGVDQFGRFLTWASMILLIVSMFFGQIWFLAALLVLIYNYFRMFSKNIAKRYAENQKYLASTARLRQFFSKKKYGLGQRKTHHIYRCPNCRQKIRVPRGRGKIEIRCPKCDARFVKKS
ncbi:MAG: hypothetical protein Q4C58_12730 [Eubacteriales bacterium]|nr:hypothetical protein [Eubacteriales bacterium]